MPSYAAFIGHQPHLSLAELAATVPGFLLHEKINHSVVLFDSGVPLDAKFMDTLGGTIVLAEKLEDAKARTEDIPEILGKLLMPIKGKVTFSLRTLGFAPGTVRDFYRKSKLHLKKKGKPSRYVGNERVAAPSIVLRDNGLLDRSHGCELCVIQHAAEASTSPLLWIGITVGAQDVDAYTKRDMEKPVRDTSVGLLPPKLAQILVNFGVWLAKKNQSPGPMVILDPFCGTGVIPMECLMRGFTALASDKSEKAITGTTKNLEWLRKQFEISKTKAPSRVWKQDATKPFDAKAHPELAKGVDAIVTETTLGPALTKRPTMKEVNTLRSDNEALQIGFLESAAASLPGVPIVCIWPVWYPSKAPVALEKVWKAAEKLGYQAVLPPTIEIVDGRMSLLYRRPDQFVGREVVIFKAKK
ncbi:hypothetical protein EXS70_00520 [Candidatus Peribacteria bacterium]|nr:hypothetical protein [Candidatus Peribacteria bacterium]